MNPLGWNSAIFNLGRSTDSPMGDVADSMLHGVLAAHARGATASSVAAGDQLVMGLGSSRALYDDLLRTARSGADDATVTSGFESLASTLKVTDEAVRTGTPSGHVGGARRAAEQVVEYLRRGIGPDQDAVHTAMWNLRNHLDEGWNSLGMAKLQGELRGMTSVT